MNLVKVIGYDRIDASSARVYFDRDIDDKALEDLMYGVQALVHEAQKRFDTGKLIPGEGRVDN